MFTLNPSSRSPGTGPVTPTNRRAKRATLPAKFRMSAIQQQHQQQQTSASPSPAQSPRSLLASGSPPVGPIRRSPSVTSSVTVLGQRHPKTPTSHEIGLTPEALLSLMELEQVGDRARPYVEVYLDRMTVRHRGKTRHTVAVQSNHPFLPASRERARAGVCYFEVLVVNTTKHGSVAVGLGPKPLTSQLGWQQRTFGLYSDGKMYKGGLATKSAAAYTNGDIIGCGINFATREIFFTKNGKHKDEVIHKVPTNDVVLYPTISLSNPNTVITVNFGGAPFRFDLSGIAVPPAAATSTNKESKFASIQNRVRRMRQRGGGTLGSAIPAGVLTGGLSSPVPPLLAPDASSAGAHTRPRVMSPRGSGTKKSGLPSPRWARKPSAPADVEVGSPDPAAPDALAPPSSSHSAAKVRSKIRRFHSGRRTAFPPGAKVRRRRRGSSSGDRNTPTASSGEQWKLRSKPNEAKVLRDGLTVCYRTKRSLRPLSDKSNTLPVSTVLANRPLSVNTSLYFEVLIVYAAKPIGLRVGVARRGYRSKSPLGASTGSYAISASDGTVAGQQHGDHSPSAGKATEFGRTGLPARHKYQRVPYAVSGFARGDVIGCGVVQAENDRVIYFTRNGEFLGAAFHERDLASSPASSTTTATNASTQLDMQPLYPALTLSGHGDLLIVNLNVKSFLFQWRKSPHVRSLWTFLSPEGLGAPSYFDPEASTSLSVSPIIAPHTPGAPPRQRSTPPDLQLEQTKHEAAAADEPDNESHSLASPLGAESKTRMWLEQGSANAPSPPRPHSQESTASTITPSESESSFVKRTRKHSSSKSDDGAIVRTISLESIGDGGAPVPAPRDDASRWADTSSQVSQLTEVTEVTEFTDISEGTDETARSPVDAPSDPASSPPVPAWVKRRRKSLSEPASPISPTSPGSQEEAEVLGETPPESSTGGERASPDSDASSPPGVGVSSAAVSEVSASPTAPVRTLTSTTPPPPGTTGSPTRPTVDRASSMDETTSTTSGLVHSASNSSLESEEPENSWIDWQRGNVLGKGAYGKVFLGLNETNGQLVAAKELKIAQFRTESERQFVVALQREIQLLRTLEHKYIVRYLGAQVELTDGECEGDPPQRCLYIFLEYVPGGSIHNMLQKFGSFSENVIRRYTRQILLGLEYLHGRGVIHRDIKGANILVGNNGVVKLADFGASKSVEAELVHSDGIKSIRGTPFWMAPEVIRNQGHGFKADIWSVGCTIIEMVTAQPPWSHLTNHVTAMYQIASGTAKLKLPDSISPSLHDLIMQCMQRDPDARPTASELLQHEFLQENGRDSRTDSVPASRLDAEDLRRRKDKRQTQTLREYLASRPEVEKQLAARHREEEEIEREKRRARMEREKAKLRKQHERLSRAIQKSRKPSETDTTAE